MSEIRYLLDENVNPILRSALLRNGPQLTVWQVGIPGAPPLGTLDPEILIWCHHLASGRRSTGVFILNAELSVGETTDELLLIADASTATSITTK